MAPGNEGEEDFLVEEVEPCVYNPTNAVPPVWQPAPQDILLMFEQMDNDQVLPLKWICPGRRPPETDFPEQPMNVMSDGEEEDDDKEEEKRYRAPEPSAFDFDDSASEASTKMKMTPRTPAQARRPEKKVACMDNIISSLKRQQKAEREARKHQARHSGMTSFRSGTPSRMTIFSPTTSPRLSTATSPGPVSPRVSAPTSSPSSRQAESGEGTEQKHHAPESPSTRSESVSAVVASNDGDVVQWLSCEGQVCHAPGNELEAAGPSGSASPSSAGTLVTVKVEKDNDDFKKDSSPAEMDPKLTDSVTVKQEG